MIRALQLSEIENLSVVGMGEQVFSRANTGQLVKQNGTQDKMYINDEDERS
jgi:hypothetical protein